MEAKTIHTDEVNGTVIIELNGHKLQYGYGKGGGDGYCYGHQSFDCIDNLTEEEKQALAGK